LLVYNLCLGCTMYTPEIDEPDPETYKTTHRATHGLHENLPATVQRS
jgi:hypothetical protein